jgi:TPR repeat protein
LPLHSEHNAISNCLLCKWVQGWLDSELESDGGHCLSDKSDAWERASSNEYELWALEPDQGRFEQADAIGKSDPMAAFQIRLDLAQDGSVWAMLKVAWSYGFGQGEEVAPDFNLAVDWYIRAIQAGSWMATRDYAMLLAKHRYFADCEAVLQDGVEKDWVPAFFWLAWYRRQQSRSRTTYREIEPLLEYAARKGHPSAQMLFARFMATGKFGFRKIPRGLKLFREQVAICVAEMQAKEHRSRGEQTETAPIAA